MCASSLLPRLILATASVALYDDVRPYAALRRCRGGSVSSVADQPFTCKVFLGNSGGGEQVFPELSPDSAFGLPALQAKPNFGVCISGGAPDVTDHGAVLSDIRIWGLHHGGAAVCLASLVCCTHGMLAGGMRAATCALGVTRALDTLGLLTQARYLSTTSGTYVRHMGAH